eukprot:TRINITY_DN20589_c0_g1_i4.p1 TRINITY_DN20589_c0_g1~~TRINITY_DN20589_c0_g1_i4.p1  ORF type:complete len:522 (-),score=85.14 TRINITY_DN20589_c0_g1_i4:301-1866(-)
MVKRALCVGCNYPSKAFGLHGAVNDAFLLADSLQRSCGFEPDEICVLHDIIPGQPRSSQRLVDASRRPTRANILARLRWLTSEARSGDVLFFSFSGYGLQVDVLENCQDGYDEAILPTDFAYGCDNQGDEMSIILVGDIHDILMRIPSGCSLTVVMDCDHATSVVDVAGTLDGRLVAGMRPSWLCGPQANATKMELAGHDRDIWLQREGESVRSRPRFQPMREIEKPRGHLPTRASMSRSEAVAFCYSAAAHGQTALELQLTRVIDGQETPKQHGVLSWCFVQALESLGCSCTHVRLLSAIKEEMARVRTRFLPRMDQQVVLTFSLPLSDPASDMVLQAPQLAIGASGNVHSAVSASLEEQPTRAFAPVIPPPPPGFLSSEPGKVDSLQVQRHALGLAGLDLWRAAWGREAAVQATSGTDAKRWSHHGNGLALRSDSVSSDGSASSSSSRTSEGSMDHGVLRAELDEEFATALRSAQAPRTSTWAAVGIRALTERLLVHRSQFFAISSWRTATRKDELVRL